MLEKDVAIIGAGPVGIFTVFQSGMLGLSTVVIEALGAIGGQCTALYPEKYIYDIPGYPSILASDLIDSLYQQSKPFNPTILLNSTMVGLRRRDDAFVIRTSKGEEIAAKAIILATGAGALHPKPLSLDNAALYEGKSLFYAVSKKEVFRDKTIAIFGGGDSAVDWTNSLADIAKKIYVIHRRDKFRALPDSVEKMYQLVKQGKVEMAIPYQLDQIYGQDGYISSVDLIDFDRNVKNLKIDAILAFFGLSMDMTFITSLGLDVSNKYINVNPISMETNLKGVYGVGDAVTYPGKLKLILTGFAETAVACHAAHAIIRPGATLRFGYSTTVLKDILK
ncbi:NAD(P)/FAD-dependent oxidoreductase [Rickettsiales endosymbiont of Peranema trichophorum]|uniref:NAD(P)/FAD-dependent oxidoreductase n=1 Tax=Rickettsiales endosymbiont of Peranema trichophorum TaxID=2486577 RepID=UPI001F5D3D60|nr:NAD(P)/FAD-dependent oxidoreductase [Rickettsiales endosymbiont of Peranema trichophorum]